MRVISQFFVLIGFIIAFISFVISTNIRFQILDANFWVNTFKKADVYGRVNEVVQTEIEKQFTLEVGKNQAKKLANIATSDLVQEVIEKNIFNLGDFANGKSGNLNVYFPFSKLPRALVPIQIKLSDEISVDKVLTTFVHLPPNTDLKQVSYLGKAATIGWIISLVFLVLHLWGVIRFVRPGERFIYPGIVFIVSGIIPLIFALLINIENRNFPKDQLIGILGFPVLLEIAKLWTFIGIFTIFVGIVILFLRNGKLTLNAR